MRGIKRFATLVWRRDLVRVNESNLIVTSFSRLKLRPHACNPTLCLWRCLAGRNYPACKEQVDLNRRDEHFARLPWGLAKCLFVTVGLTHGFSLDLKPLLVASLFVSTNSLSLNLGAQRKVGRPRHFLSQENIDNIVSLYNSGEPTSIIAEQFKAGAQRVRNILKEHNIELSPGRRRPFGPRRLGKTDWEAKAAELLIKQVERGEPMMSVGRQVNASWSTIATLLDRNASLAASLDNARAKVEEERIAEADRIGKELTAAVEEAEATARREADAALNVLTARREAKEAQLRRFSRSRARRRPRVPTLRWSNSVTRA